MLIFFQVVELVGIELAIFEKPYRAFVHKVHGAGIHCDALGTERGDGSSGCIHAREMHMHITVPAESAGDRERGLETTAERVDEHVAHKSMIPVVI